MVQEESMSVKIRYFMQSGSEPKEEITRQAFYAAGEAAGLNIHRPVNFEAMGVSYSHEIHADGPGAEELKELMGRWLDAKDGPIKLLLDEGENLPSGMTEDDVVRRPRMPQGSMMLHLPPDSHNGLQFPKAEDEGPDGMLRMEPSADGFPVWTWRPVAIKGEHTIPASMQMLEDSHIDLAGFFRSDHKVEIKPAPLPTRWRRWRMRAAVWLYEKMSGEFIEDRDWREE